jgi:aspartate kinase
MILLLLYQHNGKTTDKLILEEAEISNFTSSREHDVLVSTGEQITIAKLTMCLQKMGYPAISYTGWQIPIITNNVHGDAIIKSINTKKIIDRLNEKKIVVIAGFQGVDEDFNITTLGRGRIRYNCCRNCICFKRTKM